jgi:hypothetical protein
MDRHHIVASILALSLLSCSPYSQKNLDVPSILKVSLRLNTLDASVVVLQDTVDWQVDRSLRPRYTRSSQDKPDSGSIQEWPRETKVGGPPSFVQFRLWKSDSLAITIFSVDTLAASLPRFFLQKGDYQLHFVDLRSVSGVYIVRMEASDSEIRTKRVVLR